MTATSPLATPVSRRTALAGACTLCAVAVTGCATGQASESDGQPVRVSRTEIEIGSATVFSEHRILVTHPGEGMYRAFSAVCTHQGCAVTDIEGDVVKCLCHGSKFRLTDGSVAAGPAQKPLPERTVAVEGDAIIIT
ncbi:Rieske (2Fe-2S) protein [Nocardia sp. IBHARD005]|uniref:Rieske (2Fe-2S) protein n=1 Tax=Nocardia sp. IBHARD005 TaxID=3457765 RepID=UPI0040581EEC